MFLFSVAFSLFFFFSISLLFYLSSLSTIFLLSFFFSSQVIGYFAAFTTQSTAQLLPPQVRLFLVLVIISPVGTAKRGQEKSTWMKAFIGLILQSHERPNHSAFQRIHQGAGETSIRSLRRDIQTSYLFRINSSFAFQHQSQPLKFVFSTNHSLDS